MSIESTVVIAPNIHQADTDELANLCKALEHPARIKILQHLLIRRIVAFWTWMSTESVGRR